MVLLHVKRGEKNNEFLYETSVQTPVDQAVKDLCELHNLRIKTLRLAVSMRELGKHGPLRPEETRGLSDDKNFPLDVNAYGKPTNPDQYGYRTGCPPSPEVAQILTQTADSAQHAVSHLLVTQNKTLTKEACLDAIGTMRGAVMIAYPAFHKLPAYDPVRMELEDKEELDGRSDMQDVLETNEASAWFAGKELQQRVSKKLSDFLGRNEKTKVKLRLQNKTSGAPVRESRIDEETHKAMLSYYYKKQEENKRLQCDEDDSFLEAQWADSKALKRNLVGGGRPIGFR